MAIVPLTLKLTNQTSFVSIITKYIDKTVIIAIYTKLVTLTLGLCLSKAIQRLYRKNGSVKSSAFHRTKVSILD